MAQVWTLAFPLPTRMEELGRHVEADGWDGLLLTDSQNLAGDPYVGLAMAARATERIGLGTGVTNPVTRHPAATASAIASIQALSGGRAVLGIGRGDSALFHLGREPAPLGELRVYLDRLQGYLAGEAVDLDGQESRLRWLEVAGQPKVPVDVAATGPRVIALAARRAERVTFALGADPERIGWGLERARAARRDAGLEAGGVSYGAFVNVAPHTDVSAARELVRGGVGTFAHFSGMGSSREAQRPEDRTVFERIHATYERERHAQADARHARALDDGFIDRFAVVGPPEHCRKRLVELLECGLERLVVIGGGRGADREVALRSNRAFVQEVLPELRAA